MSATVWYEEIALAFSSLVSDLKYKGSKVPFVVRNPEEQLSKEPPCITLYFYDEKFDRKRYVEGNIQVPNTLNIEKGTVQIEDNALTYNMFVQIDLWGRTQRQIAELSKQWCCLFDSKGYLDVIDSGGTTRSCTVIKKDFHKNDDIEDGKRIYQRTYSYEIWVEIDEQIRKTVNVVTKNPRITLKNNK